MSDWQLITAQQTDTYASIYKFLAAFICPGLQRFGYLCQELLPLQTAQDAGESWRHRLPGCPHQQNHPEFSAVAQTPTPVKCLVFYVSHSLTELDSHPKQFPIHFHLSHREAEIRLPHYATCYLSILFSKMCPFPTLNEPLGDRGQGINIIKCRDSLMSY